MGDIYFSFDWIMGNPAIYFSMRDTAAGCGCEIVELKPAPYMQDGFVVIPFVIRASPGNNVEQFRHTLGEDALLNWKPSSKVVFASGKPSVTKTQLAAMAGETPLRWMDDFRTNARRNQKLRPGR